MNLDDLQADAKARLAANTSLAAIDTYIEDDASLTPDQLAAQEKAFDVTLASKGLAIMILSPFGRPSDSIRGAVAWAMTVPFAVIENIEVNRGLADPASTPPRTPNGTRPLRVQQWIIAALLPPRGRFRYTFPQDSRIERPTIIDGLIHYYLLPEIVVPVS